MFIDYSIKTILADFVSLDNCEIATILITVISTDARKARWHTIYNPWYRGGSMDGGYCRPPSD